MSKKGAWIGDNASQQIQGQSTKYSGEAEISGYAGLIRPAISALPKGWVVARIGDIAAKAVQRTPADDDEFIYVDIGSIDRNLKIISAPQKLIGKDAPSRARKVINTGDVLVSLTRPNLNAVALVGQELDNQIASTGFEIIKPITIDSRYIFALVRSKPFIDSISGKVQGALYPAAKSDDVRGYEFLLPPLAEQQQIAAKLDELLAQVDSIKTRLDAIPKILKRFRQSVLAAAVSGKLTKDWRNEKNALQEWTPKKFGDLVVYSGNGISKRSGDQGHDVTVLRLADFKSAQRIQGNERKITLTQNEIDKYRLNDGDLLVVRVNGSVEIAGLFIVYTGKEIEAYCDHFIRFSIDSNLAIPKFITYVTNEGEGRKYLRDSLSTSAGQNTINQKSINALQLRLPSKLEQTEIIHRVEQLFAYADQIEQRVKDAQARVNHLTQAILAKAFRGELTADWRAQNPDLISGENSAEALLKRIKAERESGKSGKKSKSSL